MLPRNPFPKRNPSLSLPAHPRIGGFSIEKYCKFPGPFRERPGEGGGGGSSISCEKISRSSFARNADVFIAFSRRRIDAPPVSPPASYLVCPQQQQQQQLRLGARRADTLISRQISDTVPVRRAFFFFIGRRRNPCYYVSINGVDTARVDRFDRSRGISLSHACIFLLLPLDFNLGLTRQPFSNDVYEKGKRRAKHECKVTTRADSYLVESRSVIHTTCSFVETLR